MITDSYAETRKLWTLGYVCVWGRSLGLLRRLDSPGHLPHSARVLEMIARIAPDTPSRAAVELWRGKDEALRALVSDLGDAPIDAAAGRLKSNETIVVVSTGFVYCFASPDDQQAASALPVDSYGGIWDYPQASVRDAPCDNQGCAIHVGDEVCYDGYERRFEVRKISWTPEGGASLDLRVLGSGANVSCVPTTKVRVLPSALAPAPQARDLISDVIAIGARVRIAKAPWYNLHGSRNHMQEPTFAVGCVGYIRSAPDSDGDVAVQIGAVTELVDPACLLLDPEPETAPAHAPYDRDGRVIVVGCGVVDSALGGTWTVHRIAAYVAAYGSEVLLDLRAPDGHSGLAAVSPASVRVCRYPSAALPLFDNDSRKRPVLLTHGYHRVWRVSLFGLRAARLDDDGAFLNQAPRVLEVIDRIAPHTPSNTAVELWSSDNEVLYRAFVFAQCPDPLKLEVLSNEGLGHFDEPTGRGFVYTFDPRDKVGPNARRARDETAAAVAAISSGPTARYYRAENVKSTDLGTRDVVFETRVKMTPYGPVFPPAITSYGTHADYVGIGRVGDKNWAGSLAVQEIFGSPPRTWTINMTPRERADHARWRCDDYDLNREPQRGPCSRCGLTTCMHPRPELPWRKGPRGPR